MKRHTQKKSILKHLKKGRSITPIEALRLFGCFRLSARIYDLRKDGVIVDMKLIQDTSGSRFAQYTLLKHD